MSNFFDVAIIGAGAVGSFLAGELTRQGHRVCVLERREQAGGKRCCTGIISMECAALLAPPEEIIQFRARSARIFAPSGHSIRVAREAAQAVILDRPALDRYLVTRAERNGAKYFFSSLVDDLKVTDSGVNILSSGGRGKINLKSRVAVIASGFSPTLLQAAGLGLIRQYARGAQTEVACRNLEEVEVYSGTHIAPGFFAWLVPTGNGHAKAGLLCQGNPRTYMERVLERLAGEGKIISSDNAISYGSVPLKPLHRTYSDRLIILGDAAGQVKPTTGGGIFFGVLCAQVAASTLHNALIQNDLSARRLAGYQKGWHKLLKRELTIDSWAHQFYRMLSDSQIEYIFRIIEKHGIHESVLASPDITFDWHSHVILDAIRHGSLQRSLAELSMKPHPLV